MADEDESVVIDLNDDTPPAGETAAAEKKPPPVPGPGAAPAAPQAALDDLKRQMDAERARNAEITETARRIANERDQAVLIAQQAEARGMSTYELYNENQIKAVQDKMEGLAAMAEQAMQDGDFKRASTINLQIGRLGGNLAVLERDQAVLQQQREQMGRQPAQPQQQQPQPRPAAPTDPLERAIQDRTEPTKQFLRKHPELVRRDGTLKASAIAAHERALDDGYQVDTPGYFEYIEKSLNAQIPASTNGNGAQRQPSYAAPVTRGGGGGPGSPGSPQVFTMTAKMRRLAAEQGVPEKEWAQNYVRLLNEGRITPIT